jgi:hypothetical protein
MSEGAHCVRCEGGHGVACEAARVAGCEEPMSLSSQHACKASALTANA